MRFTYIQRKKMQPTNQSQRLRFFSFFNRDKLTEFFGVDLRSLALFRICIALLILADLIRRSEDLTAHYTDAGVMPRRAMKELFNYTGSWLSFHFMGGSFLFEVTLFVMAGLFAFLLLIGYRSRLFAFLSWLMLISLHDRNIMVLYGGDALLRVMLFWGLFMPLGARFSVDAAFNSFSPPSSPRILSAATFAFVIQICLVYWTATAFKWNSEWLGGKAVGYALYIDQFATDAGLWLKAQKPLIPSLTYLTLFMEFIGPFFAFSPIFTGPLRTLTAFAFMLMHFAFATFLALGLFPFICSTAWVFFLPSWFWDHFLPRLRFSRRQKCAIYYNQNILETKNWIYLAKTFLILPEDTWHPLQQNPDNLNDWFLMKDSGEKLTGFEALIFALQRSPIFWPLGWCLKLPGVFTLSRQMYLWIAKRKTSEKFHYRPLNIKTSFMENFLAGALCLYVCFVSLYYVNPQWNFAPLLGSNWLKVGKFLHINQAWNMFSRPLKDDGWYIAEGVLLSGNSVDLLREGAPVNWRKPERIYSLYKNDRWRKYMMNLWWKSHYRHRKFFTQYLCRQWNATHKGLDKLVTVNLYYNLQKTQLDLTKKAPEEVLIWKESCLPEKTEHNLPMLKKEENLKENSDLETGPSR